MTQIFVIFCAAFETESLFNLVIVQTSVKLSIFIWSYLHGSEWRNYISTLSSFPVDFVHPTTETGLLIFVTREIGPKSFLCNLASSPTYFHRHNLKHCFQSFLETNPLTIAYHLYSYVRTLFEPILSFFCHTCDGARFYLVYMPMLLSHNNWGKSWYCGPRQRGSFFHENLSNATKSVFGNFCTVFEEFYTWTLKNAYIVKSLKCIPCAFCHRLALDKNGLKTFLKMDKSRIQFCFSSHFQKMTKKVVLKVDMDIVLVIF